MTNQILPHPPILVQTTRETRGQITGQVIPTGTLGTILSYDNGIFLVDFNSFQPMPGAGWIGFNPGSEGVMTTKLFNVQNLLWLALALALIGSLKHLAHIFASIDGSQVMGWVQAVAIDTGLFALAYSIRQRKATSRPTLPLWAGVALFSGISIYGNYTYGLLATGATLPGWIIWSKPIVLAASLPVLVLYLAELVSDNHHWAAQQVQPGAVDATEPQQPSEATEPAPTEPQPVQPGPVQSTDTGKQARLDRLQKILDHSPDISQAKMADRLGVSRTTVRNYLAELNGQVS